MLLKMVNNPSKYKKHPRKKNSVLKFCDCTRVD
uniref:Uncharacterized protein n=1 Tax=Anguilla anguilla TaxID=7936 RepID=A0A0E9UM24_ANGAN